jgi:integrase
MAKLTAKACETAKAMPVRDRLLGDGDGLFLRVRPNGSKTWIIEFEIGGHRRKHRIGVYDASGSPGETITGWLDDGRLSLAQARSIAAFWKSQRRAWHDPVAEWQARIAAKLAAEEAARLAIQKEREQPTVHQAIGRFMSKHIDGKKSATAIRYRLERLVPHFGDRKLRDVTRQDVIRAIESIAEGQHEARPAKQMAGEVLIQAKRLWRFAETREWTDRSCIESLARRDFDARPRKRDVTLTLGELADLWKALGDRQRCKADPVTVAALRLLILTGQREREVTDAEWSEFNLEESMWTIPGKRTKTGKSHMVHLAPQASLVLEQLKSITGKGRYVFASPLRPGKPVYGRSANAALATLFKRGIVVSATRAHVHDLRRTLITRLPDLGFEPFIGHKIANHSLPGVLGHYNHNEYLPKRKEALEAWAARIEALASTDKVVQLHRSAA